MSAQDLIDQVSQSLPEGCPIPLEQWVSLNFAQEIQDQNLPNIFTKLSLSKENNSEEVIQKV